MRPTATGVLVTVRRGKTNQECETRDVPVREGRRRPRDHTDQRTDRKEAE